MKSILKTLLILSYYSISFFIINYIKHDGFLFSQNIIDFFEILLASTFFSSFVSKKLSTTRKDDFNSLSKTYLKSFIINLGIITLVVNLMEGFTTSRIMIIGSLTLGFLFEFIYITFNSKFSINTKDKHVFSFSMIFLLIEFIILTWVTLYAIIFNDLSDYTIKQKILFIVIFYSIWLVNATFSRQYDISKDSNFSRIFWNHLKSYFNLFVIVSALVFLLVLPVELKYLVFFTIVLFSLWSSVALVILYIYKSKPKTDNVSFGLLNTTEFPEDFYEENNEYKNNPNQNAPDLNEQRLLNHQLKEIYLKKFPSVFNFLNSNLSLKEFNISKCVMIRSADEYNIKVLPDHSIDMYMNLHEINDFRRINNYFISVNKRLSDNGYFIGKFQSNHLRYQKFHTDYPFYLANIFYSIDFLWKRVSPKLPFIKKVFFSLTKGKNRALSMAEGLGRLYYCGFQVKAIKEINNHLYFIARKHKAPSTDQNPSYGLFFKMKRVGKNGKPIFVYKMRTMHPYSEYLQKFIHDNFSLKEGGKFENDFRVTSWGKIARKLWIDELPMIYNYLKREMKLVGIRPLSAHYLSLYDKNFINVRNKHKPGLVPPFYADMPKSLAEIQASEKKYLEKYEDGGMLVDLQYFFKAFYNIFFKKARSS